MREHGPVRVRPRARLGEAGFTLIELMVVVLIIVILMALMLPSVRNASEGPAAPTTAIAGGTIWRSIQLWRLENGGTMPATTMLVNEAAGLVDPAGTPLIRPWPEGHRGEPIVLNAGSGSVPPTTGTANTLVYAGNGNAGWLAGYGPKGSLVFSRVVSGSATPGAPLG